jgi:hypothetical protein
MICKIAVRIRWKLCLTSRLVGDILKATALRWFSMCYRPIFRFKKPRWYITVCIKNLITWVMCTPNSILVQFLPVRRGRNSDLTYSQHDNRRSSCGAALLFSLRGAQKAADPICSHCKLSRALHITAKNNDISMPDLIIVYHRAPPASTHNNI